MTFWSVKEGNPQLGYIASDGTLLPSYYHFQMLAQNFRGEYLSGTALVNGAASPHVKAFAARDVDQTVVMILNQDETEDLAYTVRLDGGAVAGPGALKVNVDTGVAREYTPPAGEAPPGAGHGAARLRRRREPARAPPVRRDVRGGASARPAGLTPRIVRALSVRLRLLCQNGGGGEGGHP